MNETIRQARMRELREARVDKNAALIDYVAMMADIELPAESEVDDGLEEENQDILWP